MYRLVTLSASLLWFGCAAAPRCDGEVCEEFAKTEHILFQTKGRNLTTIDFDGSREVHQLASHANRRDDLPWQYALSRVNFDKAVMLQHLQRIESSGNRSMSSTRSCSVNSVNADALQMDKVASVDTSVVDTVAVIHGVSGAALALGGGLAATPPGAAMLGVGGAVHGLFGTIWGQANPAISKYDLQSTCTDMINKQGEDIVTKLNEQISNVVNCVSALQNKIYSSIAHFNLLSDAGEVQRGYASIVMQMAGGNTDKNLTSNAIDRNLALCGNINNYLKWMDIDGNVRKEMQKLLPLANDWMKSCQKLGLMFVGMLRENIPFAEIYIETSNLAIAKGFKSFMLKVAGHSGNLKGYYWSASNYEMLFLHLKLHREKKWSTYPQRQQHKGLSRSSLYPFCRICKCANNNNGYDSSGGDCGCWETSDQLEACVNEEGWRSETSSAVNLYRYRSQNLIPIQDGPGIRRRAPWRP